MYMVGKSGLMLLPESDDVSRVGSVAIFFIEPIRTIKGGISNQILKLNIDEIALKVIDTC